MLGILSYSDYLWLCCNTLVMNKLISLLSLFILCGTNSYTSWPDQHIVNINDNDNSVVANLDEQNVVIVLPDLTTLAIPILFSLKTDGLNNLWEKETIRAIDQCKLTEFKINGRMGYEFLSYSNEQEETSKGNHLSDGTYFYYLDLGESVIYRDPIQGIVTNAGND